MQGPGAGYYPLAPAHAPSRGTFILAIVFFAAIGGILGGIVPRFAEVYESVDVPLPDSTRALLGVAAVFPYASPLYVLLAVLASRRLSRVHLADVLLIVAFGLFITFVVVALFLPLIGTLQGIGRP